MTKPPYESPGPVLQKEVVRPTCKVTFPLLLLWGGLLAVYLTDSGPLFPLVFPELEKFQVWRLTLSFLGSLDGLELALNLGAACLLTFISERVNGSGYYAVDLILKVFLINLLTLLAFIVLLVCSILFDTPFDPFIERQTLKASRGLLPLLTCEILFLLLNFRSDGDEWIKANFSRFTVTLLTLLLLPLAAAHYDALWFHAALLLAFLFKLRFIDYGPLLEGVGCFRVAGPRTYAKLIYPNITESVAADIYDTHDRSAHSHTTQEASAPPEQPEEDPGRFETVNVDDYKLANAPTPTETHDHESFEI